MTKVSDSRCTTNDGKPATKRRRYHSPLREQQAAETRERIIAAGTQLVHNLDEWDLKNLTARAVAEVAGVSERTVHRHFTTERALRQTVLQQLAKESGISLDTLQVDNFAAAMTQLFKYLSSFAIAPTAVDPHLAAMDDQRRMAVLDAVSSDTPGWSDHDRETVAAVLDIAWHLTVFERLQTAWGFDPERTIDTLSWFIELIEDAIRQGRRPSAR